MERQKKEEDLSTVKGRLLAYLRHIRVSQSEFARRLGVAPTYIGAMRKSIPEDKVIRICELYPDLDREWLLYGEGEMLRENSMMVQNEEQMRYEVPLLPVEAAAGRLQDWADSVSLRQCETVRSPMRDVDFAIRITGDSMEPYIHDGSTLLIKRINERSFIPWGNVMVIDTENGVLVKEVYPVESDSYPTPEEESEERYIEARSYNTKYPPLRIPVSCIYGLYRVMGCLQVYTTM